MLATQVAMRKVRTQGIDSALQNLAPESQGWEYGPRRLSEARFW